MSVISAMEQIKQGKCIESGRQEVKLAVVNSGQRRLHLVTFKERSQGGAGTIWTLRGRDAKMWSDSVYILKVEPMEFSGGSAV